MACKCFRHLYNLSHKCVSPLPNSFIPTRKNKSVYSSEFIITLNGRINLSFTGKSTYCVTSNKTMKKNFSPVQVLRSDFLHDFSFTPLILTILLLLFVPVSFGIYDSTFTKCYYGNIYIRWTNDYLFKWWTCMIYMEQHSVICLFMFTF